MQSEGNGKNGQAATRVRKEHFWLMTICLLILAMVAIAMVLHYTQTIMIPFVLSIFIVSLVSPLLDYQVIKLKFNRTMAVCITLLVVLTVIVATCLAVSEAVQTVVSTVKPYMDSVETFTDKVFVQFEEWGLDLSQDSVMEELRKKIPNLVTDTFDTVMGFVSSFVLVSIFVIFLLSGRNPHVIRKGVYADIDNGIRRYIGTKVIISSITGVLVYIILRVLGLELAAVFGMLAFLLNFIPSVGSIIATFLPLPVAVAQFQNFWMISLAIVLPGAVQMTVGNVIEPKLLGRGLDLHPVTVLMALAFWGLLWGVAGMFLAVPITAVIRIVLMQFDTLQPVGRLLSGELPGSSDTGEKSAKGEAERRAG
ncbi:Transport of quorum-sensing signal protein [Anaerohalosphaera lusitana]|uniref:Transport of quorum-sensing signal protein n=1 Tax=Anaerohalosphaera lusitana TaxID=1936003 RepID=A0A1U9NQT4_9BACT|nr:AI-2E family transporter [Anaerohalosphaera lusitana]AQT70291.1 Transport of quorum-sensing signal protein [Anaerohalosphaera lusitana]